MQRSSTVQTKTRTADTTVRDVMNNLEAGGDPRRAMAQLNARIVDCQRAGDDVPANLLRLSKALAAECAAYSQGR